MSRTERRKLARLIEQATVDAYDESEQAAGFLTIMQDNMPCPFTARVVGELVEVEGFRVIAGFLLNQAGLKRSTADTGAVRILTHLDLPARAPPRSPARPLALFQAA